MNYPQELKGAAPKKVEGSLQVVARSKGKSPRGLIYAAWTSIHNSMEKTLIAMACIMVLSGCQSKAHKLYSEAAATEAAANGYPSFEAIAAYKEVIAADPGSEWAYKAQTRIDAINQRMMLPLLIPTPPIHHSY